jgi:signal transduction histidine kinase
MVMAALRAAEAHGRSQGQELELPTSNGPAWFELSTSRKEGDATPHRFLMLSRNISNRKVLEREIIEVSTTEQQRIGHDIHDGIGQQLTGLAMLASSLVRRLAASGLVNEAAAARELQGYAQEALEDARALSRGLAPVEIGAEGLAEALSGLIDEVSATTGIACRYDGPRLVCLEHGSMAGHLFRIAQEAMQNAVKHAEPKHIDVGLKRKSGEWVLTVRDDGKGIDQPSDRRGHMGLHIMGYRAGIIGGSFHVGPAEGGGTLVRCEVPIPESR